MSDSVRPYRRQPTRLPLPWDSPGKNTGVGCHFLLQCMKVKSEREVAQSCPTPSDPMDCSPPGPSVHGIFQTRVLEWGARREVELCICVPGPAVPVTFAECMAGQEASWDLWKSKQNYSGVPLIFFFFLAKFLPCSWAHYFANKGPSSQGYVFSNVWM